MFEFSVGKHTLTRNGETVEGGDQCYSGTGPGRNNVEMEDARNVGPIPRGKYRIGPAHDDPERGPCVMALTPMLGTNEFGRSGFLIHGNNAENDASHGCLIAPPMVRDFINASQDRILFVTS